jgi:hypothetical protein
MNAVSMETSADRLIIQPLHFDVLLAVAGSQSWSLMRSGQN